MLSLLKSKHWTKTLSTNIVLVPINESVTELITIECIKQIDIV